MGFHRLRSWLNPFDGRRPHTRRRPPAARLSLERFEDRTVPSASIPLNGVDPNTQQPQIPNWTAIGPAAVLNGSTIDGAVVSGRVSGVAVDPTNANRIFAAAASGGIWRSLDGGAHWTPLTLHLPDTTNTLPTNTPITDAQRTLNIGAIAMAPSNPNVIYAAEGEGDSGTTGFGVLVSTDGGDTWTLTGTDVFAGISSHSIVVDNLDPNIAYVANQSPINGGIYRTLDGGATWVNITAQSGLFQSTPSLAPVFAFTDVDLVPRQSLSAASIVYACAGDQNGDPRNGIYRTVNGGNANVATVTWNELIGGAALVPGARPGNIQITISPTLPSTIYASIADSSNPVNGDQVLLGVYKTTDGGVNWQRLGTPPTYVPNYLGTQGGYDNVIIVDPFNPNVVIMAGDGTGGAVQNLGAVLLTTDGGQTFFDITTVNGTSPHTDDHAGQFDANGNFLMGCDGGLVKLMVTGTPQWVSLNGTNTSNPTVTALNTVQFYSVALNSTDANFALGGSQDNGTERFNDNIGWTQTDGGDGEKVVYDFDNPLHALHVIPLGSGGAADYIEITNDGGQTWQPYGGGIGNLAPNTTLSPSTLLIDPSNSQRYFIGTDELSISQDGGVTWSNRYTFAAGANQTVPGDPSSNIPPAMGGPFPITAVGLGRSAAAGNLPMFLASHVDGTLYQLFLPPPPSPAPMTTSWINIAGGAPGGSFVASRIIVDPQNPENAYLLGIDGNGKSDVLRTQDLNALVDTGTFPTFTDLTGNLPPLLFTFQSAISSLDSAMALDPKNFSDPSDDVLYVAGRSGQIFQLTNPGGSTFVWTRVGTPYDSTTGKGMPDVDVTDLELNTTTGILGAGTYGSGMWEIQVRGLIRGEVFLDTNGNGQLDTGEKGMAGVTVRLLNADTGVEIANTVTDANGIYQFRSLTASQLTATNYQVVEVKPNGDVETTATLNFANLNEQSTFDISDPNLTSGTVVIGNFVPGSISGTKFNDLNANGFRDAGEPGVAGFVIYVDSNNNGVLDPGEISTTSSATGAWTLTNLGPPVIGGVANPMTFNGTYIIREAPKVGWVQTTPLLPAFTITSGLAVTGQLIGNTRTASIAGTVFVDTNGDGIRQAGEPGEAGITVTENGPGGARSVVTAADGTYTFFSLAPGTYTLTETVPTGFVQTTTNPAPITIAVADQITGVDFGNFKKVSISGTKFNDLNGNGIRDGGEPGLANFVFDLIDPSSKSIVAKATSSATGAFSFANVGPLAGGGAYQITEEQQTGWTQTTPNPAAFTPTSGTAQTGFLFGNFNAFSISGTAYLDLNGNSAQDPGEVGASGFVIQLRSGNTAVATTTSAADGTFSISGVGPGTYTLVELPRTGFAISQGANGYAITGTSAGSVTGENFGNVNRSIIVVSKDSGSQPTVTVRNAATQAPIRTFNAYASTFTGGVRVATGLFGGGQSLPDIVTAPGPGGGPDIRVFDTATGVLIAEFFAYAPSFTGGVYVAVGDVNGDGVPDIITGADAGGGPHVEVWNGASVLAGKPSLLNSFFAYGASFHGGVRVASADVDGDGFADIITGAGPGGGPHVEVFSGRTGQQIRSFFAYAANFTGGVYVAGGDVNGDGFADIITGPGLGGGPHLRVFDGTTGSLLEDTFAYPPTSSGGQISSDRIWQSGLRVGAIDLNQDGRADIIVGPGVGQSPQFKVLDSLTFTNLLTTSQELAFDPSFLGGVFVAGD